MKRLLLITGFLILFIVEIARVYFIMPFSGSQHQNTIDLAYWLNNNSWWLRIVSLLLIVYPLQQVQASQEFWHSWQTLHPATTLYIKPVR